jgi:hypothetical protein
MASRGDTIDKAIALKSDADVVERLRERMPEMAKQLEEMACGNVPRNAQTILKAIETVLRYTQPLPKVTVAHEGSIGMVIEDPYAERPEGDDTAAALPPPAAQAVVPVTPIRRRRPPAPAVSDWKPLSARAGDDALEEPTK